MFMKGKDIDMNMSSLAWQKTKRERDINVKFQTELKKELNQTRLRISLSGLYTEDYQIRMLRENHIRGLLPINGHGEGENTVYEYDITGLVSLSQYYKQKKITGEEMDKFLKQIQAVIEETESYLLNPNRLLMNPEYIFYEEDECRFCYFPQGDEDIRMSFHRLMDDFVQWTDYQDIPSVKTAFFLHKETMKENYSLTRIVRELEKMKEEAEGEENDGHSAKKQAGSEEEGKTFTDQGRREAEGEIYVPEESRVHREQLWQQRAFEYDNEEHDWISRQEKGSKILKETDNLWSPVKRLLHRHKRPKWGDWDGIYIDEEDF